MTSILRFCGYFLLTFALVSAFSLARTCAQTQNTEATLLSYEVIQQIPHSGSHFTQGLFFYDNNLYESTGNYGRSKLIRYDSDYKTILMSRSVPAKYFAEGATVHNDLIYQLTWKEQTAFAYDPSRLAVLEGFNYVGEGWGLVSDGESLWMSDGSDQLKKIDTSGTVLETTQVTFNGNPLNRLNELEWVNGAIYANRWFDNRIFVIDPSTGNATHYLDLNALAKPELNRNTEHVLNGIAWHPESETLWITGKNWLSLYELKVNPAAPQ